MFFNIDLNQDRSEISNYISSTLLLEIEKTLKKGEKVLLYLNKRGAYSSLVCEDCHYLFECPNCDTSLSVHQNPHHLKCHICSNAFNVPLSCPKCHGNKLKSIGIGTQQIEQVLRGYFTKENIYRFDSDNMKTISSKKAAIQELEKANIIIGTKMLTTGFNFDSVGLISVLLIESELSYPSYDAYEKAYSNIRQFIGRGNRKEQKTNIILQSFIPKNTLIKDLTENNFKDFFTKVLKERKNFNYPPYSEMATLEYRNIDAKKALNFTEKLEITLREKDPENNFQILRGSSTYKKNNSYHATLVIKGKGMHEFLKNIQDIILRESNLSVIF